MQELVSYAPIKVLSISPMQANEGSNQGIRINFAPEQGNLTHKLNIKLRTFQLNLSLSKTWGLDQKFYPTVRKSPFKKIKSPTIPPRSACAWM